MRSYLSEGGSVLDFGCGEGYLLQHLGAKRRVGVEVNSVALEHAWDLEFEMYSSLKMLEGQSFSRIISQHVLEHIPSP
ncbi:class I SAM-dependent methyltransferase [Methylacidimicrobium tartarophylax]|uniref:class I SAM-dependent methyltransferase n=1 Tax=Methylacidimicrobium tartarophylax TaxID=1041768 RepID=UPI0034E0CE50